MIDTATKVDIMKSTRTRLPIWIAMLAAALWSFQPSFAQLEVGDPDACFVVADEGTTGGVGNGSTIPDTLFLVDRITGIATNLGDTGSSNIEAIAYNPFDGVLYAMDGATLVSLDYSGAGGHTVIGDVGSGNGSTGTVVFTDIDSLDFDFSGPTPILYGTQRMNFGAPDILIAIDLATGALIQDHFGPGVDYVEIGVTATEDNIDDIAVDCRTGVMYGILNNGDNSTFDRLVTINKSDGSITDIGSTGIFDMEGLAFDTDGVLFGSTGNNGDAPTTANHLFDLGDPSDADFGVATNGNLVTADGVSTNAIGFDFEALTCNLPAPLVDVGIFLPNLGQCVCEGSPIDVVIVISNGSVNLENLTISNDSYVSCNLTIPNLPALSVTSITCTVAAQAGTNTVFVEAVDCFGRRDADAASVAVDPSALDQDPPFFLNVPPNSEIACDAPIPPPADVTAEDACSLYTNVFNDEACFLVADEGNTGGDGNGSTIADVLYVVDPNGTAVEIGLTGTLDIEAIAFNPEDGQLYAEDGATLVTLDWQGDGSATVIGAAGSANGSEGTITFTDLDSMDWDLTVNPPELYATQRRLGAADLLVKIDPTTGAVDPNGFGAGVGYVVIGVTPPTDNIDDIAIDPATGRLYGILNDANNATNDELVEIDKATGAIIGAPINTGVFDMEGLSFDPDGALFGSTGNNGDAPATANSLFDLGVPGQAGFGSATNRRRVNDGLGNPLGYDFEALTCYVSNIAEVVTNDIVVSFSATTNLATCPGVIQRVWTAVDACGNSASATQTITVVDDTGPVLSGVPADVSVECDNVPAAPVVTADDACDPSVTVVPDEQRVNGACPDSYTIVRTWSATDDCANTTVATQLVTVADTTPPDLFGVPGDVDVECGNIPMPPSVTATDVCDAAVTPGFSETRINGPCPDTYTLQRVWTATDDCGNTAMATQLVNVSDTTAPGLNGVPADTTAECDAIPDPPNVTANDNCDATVQPSMTPQVIGGGCPNEFTLLRVWSASDDCGNTVAATQTITVIDTTPPEANCPSVIELVGDENCQAPLPEVEVSPTDNCSATNDLIVTQDPPPGTVVSGALQVSVTVTVLDQCGNATTCTIPITVDCSAPAITLEKTVYLGRDGAAGCPGDELVVNTNSAPITYCFVVSNSGPVILYNVELTDADIAMPAQDIGTLTPGSTYTFAYGTFLFSNLVNTAQVTGEGPDGSPVQDSDPAEVREVPLGAIGDTVFIDAVDDNTTYNPAEDTPLAGVTVNLIGTNVFGDVVTLSDVTDANGFYLFPNLVEGTYVITVDKTTLLPQLQGDTETYDFDGGDDSTSTYALGAGETNLDQDFGYLQPVAGIEIVKTAGTAPDGGVHTINAPGTVTYTYLVRNTGETYLSDIVITDDAGTPGNALDDVTLTSVQCPLLAGPLAPAGTVTCTASIPVSDSVTNIADVTGNPTDGNGNDFPGVPDPTDSDDAVVELVLLGSIGDTVFVDAIDDNTTYNPGEGDQPLSGVTVILVGTDSVGNVINDSTVTDGSGQYLFPDLPAGNYTVTVDTNTLPTGVVPTFDDDGGDDHTSSVTLAPGEDNLDQDFGYERPEAGVQLVKTAGTAPDGGVYTINAPGNVTYTYVVRNIGGTHLSDIVITDDAGTPGNALDDVTLTSVQCPLLAGPLAPAGTVTCTSDIAVSDSVTNIAGVTGNPTDENGTDIPGVPDPTDTDDAVVELLQLSLGDTVWFDPNNNGVQDPGETGIAGVVVSLWEDTNGDGQPDVDTGLNDTTDGSGNYLFEGLAPGDYVVQIDPVNFTGGQPLEGMVSSDGSPDPDDDVDGDDNGYPAGAAGILSTSVTLTASGEPTAEDGDPNSNLTVDFGLYQPLTLGDTVWLDLDNSGTQDAGEPGVAGVVVELLQGGTVIDSTTTDGNGNYLFEGLAPGDYVVRIPAGEFGAGEPLEGTASSTGNQPTSDPDDDVELDDNGDPVAGGHVQSQPVTLLGGTEPVADTGSDGGAPDDSGNTTVDFGVYPLGSIGDTVFIDAVDDDSTYNPGQGDQPLPGVTVILSGTDSVGNVINDSRVTDSGGTYLFDDLPEGSYTVTVDTNTLPTGVTPTFDDDGGDDHTSSVTLAPGEDNLDQDFGYERPEAGVQLVKTAGTAPDGGVYTINAPGNVTYTYVVRNIGGTHLSDIVITDDAGTPGNALDDVTLAAAQCPLLAGPLAPAGTVTCTADIAVSDSVTNIAGVTGNPTDENGTDVPGVPDPTDTDDAVVELLQLSLGDTVWFDPDNNSVQDPGETGIPGVVVSLWIDTDGDGLPDVDTGADDTTDGSGNYLFEGLAPGDYVVQLDPVNFAPGQPLEGMVSSDGSPDPDDDVDGDDNGFPAGGAGILSTSVTLTASGEPTAEDGDPNSNLTVDFGLYQPLTLGDTVWLDLDNSGTQDAGEPGIPGVVVELLQGGTVIDSTSTDGNGNYLFEGLAPGDYVVRIPATEFGAGEPLEGTASSTGNQPTSDPDDDVELDDNGDPVAGGHMQSQPVTLLGGTEPVADTGSDGGAPDDSGNTTVDFGVYPLGSIGDTVFIDAVDDDSTYNPGQGDQPLPGVTVILSGTDSVGNVINDTRVTDSGGTYLFDDLPEGSYTVTVDTNTLPTGVTPTFDDDGGDDHTSSVTLAPGEDNLDQDFGYERPEAGVQLVKTAGTAPDGGVYTINAPGNVTYTYVVRNIGGTHLSDIVITDDAGTPGNALDDVTLTSVQCPLLAGPLTPAGTVTCTADIAVSDSVTNIAGVTGNPTDENGTDIPGVPDPTDTDDAVVELLQLSLGDTVWFDPDNNSVQDPGETGIPGVVVSLWIDTDGDGLPDVDTGADDTTDGSGNYLFEGLAPGDYVVQLDPVNFAPGQPLEGMVSSDGSPDPDDDVDGDDNGFPAGGAGILSTSVTLTASGEPTAEDGDPNSNLTVDFGLYQPLTLGDTVWLDLDNSGTQDAGEPGIPGVVVELLQGGTVIDSTTTDGNGNYLFEGLAPGDYVVRIPAGEFGAGEPLEGTASSTGNQPTSDPDDDVELDDNGDPVAGGHVQSQPVTLLGGTEPVADTGSDGGAPDDSGNATVDFGVYPLGSIGDTVFIDAIDDDSTYNPGQGDQPLPGVTVILSGTDSVGNVINDTRVTDSGGTYLFDDLPEGSYTVTVDTGTLPPGVNPTFDDDGGDDHTSAEDLAPGEDNLDQDFGYEQPEAGIQLIKTAGGAPNGAVHTINAPGPVTYTYEIRNIGGTHLSDIVITDDAGTPGDALDDVTLTAAQCPLLAGPLAPAGAVTCTTDIVVNDSVTNIAEVTGNPTEENGTDIPSLPDPTDEDEAIVELLQLSLGDTVWEDPDNNGVQDPGESGIPGVEVSLWIDTDGDGLPDVDTGMDDTTDGNGNYLFEGLAPGDYVVQLDPVNFAPGQPLEGMMSSDGSPDPDDDVDGDDNGFPAGAAGILSTSVTLTASGEPTAEDGDPNSNLTVDFGLYEPLSLGDQVWFDVNNSGAIDPGEIALDGVTLTLWVDTDDDGTPDIDTGLTDITDANGFYLFDGLTEGNYIIQVDPENFASGGALAGFVSSTGNGVTAPDPDDDTEDDDNGNPHPTLGVISAPITLSDDGEPTTDTGPDTGGADEDNSNETLDFGFYQPMSVGDLVFEDSNNNGVQDAGEDGIPGISLSLWEDTDGDGEPDVDTGLDAATDLAGRYSFLNLIPGDYVVQVDPENFAPGEPLEGYLNSDGQPDPDDDNNITENGRPFDPTLGVIAFAVTLEPDLEPIDDGDSNPNSNFTVDFGFYQEPLSLGDQVWLDLDNSGTLDPGESGVPGVVLSLREDTNDDNLPDSDTGLNATTDGNGYYLFDNLAEGHYVVQVDPSNFAPGGALEGFQSSTGIDGVGGAPDPDNDTEDDDNGDPAGVFGVFSKSITLAINEEPTDDTGPSTGSADDDSSNETLDFGFFQNASLGDRVWYDEDGDGVQDAGEPGIPDVTVNLLDPAGGFLDSTTTGTNGLYVFDELPPGSYIVEFVYPTGAIPSPRDQGGDDTTDSDPDPGTGRTDPVDLLSGQDIDTVDAGLFQEQIVSKNVTPPVAPSVAGNAQFNYVITVQNPGALAAGPVTITDPLPVWASYVSDDAGGSYNGSEFSVTIASIGGGETLEVNVLVEVIDPAADSGLVNTAQVMVGSNEYTVTETVAGVGDTVWFDEDQDGIQDTGEPTLPGVTVTISDTDGNPVATDVTDPSGTYFFIVPPGDYVITFTPPAGGEITDPDQGLDDSADSDPDPLSGATPPVTLDPGEIDETVDAGIVSDETVTKAVGDLVAPAPSGAVRFEYLITVENDSAITKGPVVITDPLPVWASYVSDDAGGGLNGDGEFEVTIPTLGPDASVVVTVVVEVTDPTSDEPLINEAVVMVGSNEYVVTAEVAKVGDFVWQDLDGDGVQDGGEPGVPGVPVTLEDSAGNPLGSTTTDPMGEYGFIVPPGTYQVDVDPPAGATITTPDNAPDDETDSDADSTGTTPPVTVAAGETNDTLDVGITSDEVVTKEFGDIEPPSFAGNARFNYVITVENTSALAKGPVTIVDPLPAWVQYVSDDAGGGLNGDGAFEVGFASIAAFETITVNVLVQVSDADTDSSLVNTAEVTVAGNEYQVQAEAAQLGDFVFQDLDGNAVQDPTDPGVPDVLVTLRDTNGNPVASTLTDPNGEYQFTVPPGVYVVDFDPPAGLDPVPPDMGGDDTIDSDGSPVDGTTPPVTLQPGDRDDTIDLGLTEPVVSKTPGDFLDISVSSNALFNYLITISNPSGLTKSPVTVVDSLPDWATYVSDNSGGGLNGDGDFEVTFASIGPGETLVVDILVEVTQPFDQGSLVNTAQVMIASNAFEVETEVASVGDRVWEDSNENGLQDPGEPGIGGVPVLITDAQGNPVALVQTEPDGFYQFIVPPGDYLIEFMPGPGRDITRQNEGGDDTIDSDADPDTGMSPLVTLDAGERDPTIDAGVTPQPGSIGDTVFQDEDPTDGNYNPGAGDTPLPGVTVILTGTNNAGEPVMDSTVTDGSGNYLFTNVPPGDYVVSIDESTLPPSLQGDQETYDNDGGGDSASSVVLPPDSSDLDQDFGYAPNLGSIGDTVFQDAVDDDTTYDPGADTPLAGVTVTIDGVDVDGNPVNDSTVTDGAGFYVFTNLLEGTYTLAVDESTLPVPLQGNQETYDFDGSDDSSSLYPLAAGEHNRDQDFGYAPSLGSIGDTVFLDEDPTDGGYNPGAGDTPLTNVTVQLVGVTSNGTPVNLSTNTDGGGNYLFPDLPPGTYTVSVSVPTLPADLEPSYDDDGGNDHISVVELGPASDDLDQDFGYTPREQAAPTGRIGDTVFLDDDPTDGGFDEFADTPLANVTVTLVGTNVNGDPVSETTVTDGGGNYLFTNLFEGNYVVTIDVSTLPPGVTASFDPDGGEPNRSVVDLGEGESDLDQDFGYLAINPSIVLEKSTNGQDADTGSGPAVPAGGNVTWVYEVRNDGNVDLADVVVTDDVIGRICVIASLPVGATEFCTTSGVATVGPYENMGTATGTPVDEDGEPVVDEQGNPPTPPVGEDPSHYFGTGLASVNIEKATNGQDADSAPGPILSTGDAVTWTYLVINDGQLNLTNVVVTDDVIGEVCTIPFLPVGVSTTCTASGTAVNGQYMNTGTATGTPVDEDGEPAVDEFGNPVIPPTDSDPSHYFGSGPGIDIVKTVYNGHDNGAGCPGVERVRNVADAPVTYCFVVENTGNTHLSNVTVTDPALGFTTNVAILAPGATATFHVEAAVAGDLTNVASVTGNPTDEDGIDLPGVDDPTDDDDAIVDEINPSLVIVKSIYAGHDDGASCATAQQAIQVLAGADITYCITVSNSGDTPLANVTITDNDVSPPFSANVGTLAPGASASRFIETTADAALVNLASVTGTPVDETGEPIPDVDPPTDEDDAEVIPVGPGIEVIKTVYAGDNGLAGCPGVEEVVGDNGDPVTYCIQVRNIGDTHLADVIVTDAILGFSNSVALLAPGASETFAVLDAIDGDLVNTATATGTPSNPDGTPIPEAPDVTDEDTASVDEIELVSIGDHVFIDANGNGVQDPGDLGLGGVTVTLLDEAGNPVGTPVITDGDGNYEFLVPPGVYHVQITLPGGVTASPANQGTDDNLDSDGDDTGRSGPVTVVAGQDDDTIDFGLVPATPSVTKGIDSPVGSAGFVTFDYEITVLNSGDIPLIPAVVTDPLPTFAEYLSDDIGGSYDAATHTWSVDLGSVPANDSVTFHITVRVPAANAGQALFNIVEINETPSEPARAAFIGDRVFLDQNGNHTQDPTDPGLSGVTVELIDSSGTIVGTTITDANGDYGFIIPPGTYTVRFTPPADHTFVTQDVGDDTLDSDANPTTGITAPITVAADERNQTVDAGLVAPPDTFIVAGQVRHDVDGDGDLADPDDPVPGVTIEIWTDPNGDGDPLDGVLIAITNTDDNGEYLFIDVPAGNVVIVENDLPATASTGDVQGERTDNRISILDLRTDTFDQDFLDAQEVRLGNRVWEDLDANGMQDPNEPGVGGITVVLLDGNGAMIDTTTTDENGLYEFVTTPGVYRLEFVLSSLPPNYEFTGQNFGGDDSIDSDAAPGNGLTPFTPFLPAGTMDDSFDAGIVGHGSIGDTVWIDVNENGVPDENLAVLGFIGATVELYEVVNGFTTLVDTAVTTDNGFYEFDDLPAGVYHVSLVLPDNLLPTALTTPAEYTVVIQPGTVNEVTDFGFSENPTAIELASFRAVEAEGGVAITFVTASEIDNLGFFIHRGRGDEPRELVTPTLILAEGSGVGQTYKVFDPTGDAGYNYWLEDIDTLLVSTLRGPFGVAKAAVGDDLSDLGAGLHLVRTENPEAFDIEEDGEVRLSLVIEQGLLVNLTGSRDVVLVPSSTPRRMAVADAAPKGESLELVALPDDGVLELPTPVPAERYLVTGHGGELYAIDLSDPRAPVQLEAPTLDSDGLKSLYLSIDADANVLVVEPAR